MYTLSIVVSKHKNFLIISPEFDSTIYIFCLLIIFPKQKQNITLSFINKNNKNIVKFMVSNKYQQ